jgi:hypothetical protein
MDCRPGCGACCIAPSISSFIPDMPHGKPAGVRCVQLNDDFMCRLFGSAQRPAVCRGFRSASDTCGASRVEGLAILSRLEAMTR